MQPNLGSVDRGVRAILGLNIGITSLFLSSWFGLIGLVLLGTAMVGRCPLYMPFGISTCKLHSEGSSS